LKKLKKKEDENTLEINNTILSDILKKNQNDSQMGHQAYFVYETGYGSFNKRLNITNSKTIL